MRTSFSNLIEIGTPAEVEYCDNVIEQSSTGKLNLLRYPIYIPTTTTDAKAMEIINIQNVSTEQV